jgi:hypothetical protein
MVVNVGGHVMAIIPLPGARSAGAELGEIVPFNRSFLDALAVASASERHLGGQ